MPPRLPPITDREALPEDKRAAFDYIVETRGRVAGAFGVIMNSPEIASRAVHFGNYIRFQSPMARNVRELAALAASMELDNKLEIAAHTRGAAEAGVNPSTVDAVLAKRHIEGDDEEALAIRSARELLSGPHRLSDATFQALQNCFGNEGAVDVIATIGYYALLACLMNGLNIEPVPAQ